MKLKFDAKSIKIKIWAYVMLFSIVILCLLWLLQIVFLDSFYRASKQGNITSGAQSIASVYNKVQGSALWSQIDSIAENSDFSVSITDKDGMTLYSTNPVGRDYVTPMQNNPIPDPNHPQNPSDNLQGQMEQQNPQSQQGQNIKQNGRTLRNEMFKGLATEILAQQNGELLRSFKAGGRDMLMYGKVIYAPDGTEAVLITSSPLQPLDETITILSKLFVYMSIIIIGLAVAISLIIAIYVSKPIIKITDKARLLANGDYDLTFERGKYTEVDQLANTLNYATKGMQQAEKMRNELIANVSHDLRTPLTMIRVYAEMIRDLYTNDPEACVQNADIIIEESDRLTYMVQDLLELSKLQAGTNTYEPTVFNLTHMIETIIAKFNIFIQKEGYHIEFPKTRSFYVLADEHQVEQVLYNLISNAINYTGADKNVHVVIADRDTKVRVLISDSGNGIDPKDIPLIWERYYKGSNKHKRGVISTGLGLSIVKSILTAHGTDFGVDSIVGEGSTFWFELDQTDRNDLLK